MEIHQSEVDLSFYAILGLNAILTLTFCIIAQSVGSSLFVIALFLFIFHQLHSIKYKIDTDNHQLIISGGIFYNSSLDISAITSIKKERTFLAAPAAAFDRITIRAGRKAVSISPKRQADFIEEIKKINPSIDAEI